MLLSRHTQDVYRHGPHKTATSGEGRGGALNETGERLQGGSLHQAQGARWQHCNALAALLQHTERLWPHSDHVCPWGQGAGETPTKAAGHKRLECTQAAGPPRLRGSCAGCSSLCSHQQRTSATPAEPPTRPSYTPAACTLISHTSPLCVGRGRAHIILLSTAVWMLRSCVAHLCRAAYLAEEASCRPPTSNKPCTCRPRPQQDTVIGRAWGPTNWLGRCRDRLPCLPWCEQACRRAGHAWCACCNTPLQLSPPRPR